MANITLTAMADNLTQPGVRVNEQKWERFRQFVLTRHDGIRGHLRSELEAALIDRIDAYEGGDTHDRLKRIEERVADIQAAVSENDSDGGIDSNSKTTESRINEIMSDIQDRADELDASRVSESDVEAAIERNAGASYKTIQRYKKLLQNQRKLFAHPTNDDVYFVKPQAFVVYVENAVETTLAADILETYGAEWWEENAPDGFFEDDGRAFA